MRTDLSELPEDELDTYLLTVGEATDLARTGKVTDGYRCLQGGLARAVEAREAGEAWAGELVAHYLDSLRRFEESFGVGYSRN